MNSKDEWNGPRVPRISVEVGSKVITEQYKGQPVDQGLGHLGTDEKDQEERIKTWEMRVQKKARTRSVKPNMTTKRTQDPTQENIFTGGGGDQRAKARKVNKDNRRVTTATGASRLDNEPVRPSTRSWQDVKDPPRAMTPPILAPWTMSIMDKWTFRNTDIRYRGQQGQGRDEDKPIMVPDIAPTLIKAKTQVPPASTKAGPGTYSQKGKGQGARKGGPKNHQLTLENMWNRDVKGKAMGEDR